MALKSRRCQLPGAGAAVEPLVSPPASSLTDVKITPSATRPPASVFEPISKRLNVILRISPEGMVSTGPLGPFTVIVAQLK